MGGFWCHSVPALQDPTPSITKSADRLARRHRLWPILNRKPSLRRLFAPHPPRTYLLAITALGRTGAVMTKITHLTRMSPSQLALAAFGVALVLAGAACVYVGQAI